MKVLLIRHHFAGNVNDRTPYSLDRVVGFTQPLGIAYIASALLDAGHEVSLLDNLVEGLTSKETLIRIKAKSPDVVGVTAMTPTIKGALEAARLAKETGAITVIGGSQMSILPRETLMHDFVDFGIIGEGETTMVNLVNALKTGTPLRNIKGLAYKENNQIHINEPSIELDLDSISLPARHLVPVRLYNSILSLNRVTTMISSRGCPYRCGFCSKQPSDKIIRFRNPKLVVDEMEEVARRYNIKEVIFYDDTITLRRQHIVDICEEILHRNLKISWIAPTRVNHVNPDLLKLMKRAGCRQLRYGVESGDQMILDLMHKDITLDQARDAFRWSKETGIETFAFFLVAYPGENEETVKRTISFAKEINPDLVEFSVAAPVLGTEMFAQFVEKGTVDSNYWHDFTLLKRDEPIPCLLENVEKYMAYAYRSFYFRPGYLIRRLKTIRSWDSLVKHVKGAYAFLNFRLRAPNGT